MGGGDAVIDWKPKTRSLEAAWEAVSGIRVEARVMEDLFRGDLGTLPPLAAQVQGRLGQDVALRVRARWRR